MINLTPKTIAVFDEALDAEMEKAVQWYQEQLNACNWTELEISMFELMEICCNQLESHIRKADPRSQWQKFADERSRAFNRRYYNNPDGEPVFKY